MNEKITPIWKNHPELRNTLVEDQKNNPAEEVEINRMKKIRCYFTFIENFAFDKNQLIEKIKNSKEFSNSDIQFFSMNPYEKIPGYKDVVTSCNLFGRITLCVYEIIVYQEKQKVKWQCKQIQ